MPLATTRRHRDAAEDLLKKGLVGDLLVELLLELLDDVIVRVEVAHPLAVEEVLEVTRGLLGEIRALGDHRRDDRRRAG